jgi:rRNA maturation RNase YbeY
MKRADEMSGPGGVPPRRKVSLGLFNRQKTRRVDAALWRRAARSLLEELPPHRPRGGKGKDSREDGRLGVHLIDAKEMTRLNEEFLGHAGSTDVITFNYQEQAAGFLSGEIFISVDDAVAAAPRFRTTWQSELVRYLAHGMLHLRGYEDDGPSARREMKKEENRLLKQLSRRLDWGRLERLNHGTRRK